MAFFLKSRQPRMQVIGGTITIGAAGAIASNTNAKYGGTPVKTAAKVGRYTVTFIDTKYTQILGAHVEMAGVTDAAFPTTTGSDPKTRNLATTSFDIQCKRTDTQADAEPASGTVLSWFALVVR